jgi:5-methylcytosine-specific restriction endonuclease McrA
LEEKKPRRKGAVGLINTLPKMQQDFCWFCLRRKEVLRLLKPAIGFEVHHIIPVEDGGTDEQQNLILLCRECHVEVHRRQEAFKRYRALMASGATE